MKLNFPVFRELFFTPSRLRRKFLRAFLIVGLVPLLTMGAVGVYLLNLIHRLDTTELAKFLANQTALEVKQIMESAVDAIAVEVTSDEAVPLTREQEEVILRSLLTRNPRLYDLAFVCTNAAFCAPGEETSRLDRRSASTTTRAVNVSDTAFFGEVAQGKTFVGLVRPNPERPSVKIGAPVLSRNKKVVAALSGTLELDDIASVVALKRLGETGYAYLLNPGGSIIAHPDLALIGTSIDTLTRGNSAAGKLFTEESDHTAVYRNFRGETVLGVSRLISNLGWTVVVEWPRAERERAVNEMIAHVIRFSLLALLLTFIIGGILTANLIRPLNTIKEGAREIGRGNFAYHFTLKTRDELEELGNRLNAMAADLKGLQELRDLQLRTELLAESLRKEQELSKLKDQFVRTVSHQFNTPLSIIHWTLEMIGDPKANPQTVREGLLTINQSRKDILGMVDNLLTLSEIGFRYEKANFKPLNLRTLVNETISKLHEDVTEKNLTIQFKEETSDLGLEGNEFALRKAIENIIKNAVIYSHRGGKIELTLGGAAEEVQLTVRDYGIGIPDDEQKSVFGEFFRASNAVLKKNVGTGLGLFIAKTIITGHGGAISFTSKENIGSTFAVILPRKS